MATAGDIIKLDYFNHNWDFSWSDQHSNNGQVRYVYICAPVWYMLCDCWYFAFGGSGQFTTTLYYYDGSSFVQADSIYHNGAASTDGITRYYGHNRNEGGSYFMKNYQNDYPLWKIKYWPARGNTRWKITFWVGGYGMIGSYASKAMTNDEYPDVRNGKPCHIFSRGRTGTFSGSSSSNQYGLYYTYTADIDSQIVSGTNLFNSSARRGAQILAGDDSELIWAPYLENRLTG